MVGPSSSIAITEHSTCQPGRPTPNGARHAGSSGPDGCQHEVERVATVRVVGVAAAHRGELHHAVLGIVRQRTERRERRHVEVRGAGGQVRVAGLEQLGDEVDDDRDRFGRTRFRDRFPHLERGHVGVEARHLRRRQFEVRHAELASLRQDRVVDVGDVAHHPHFVTEVFEAAHEQVVREVRRGVAEVRRVVRRDAADVHPYHVRRLERHDRPLRRVVEAHFRW